jgi:serine/threonine protein kinase
MYLPQGTELNQRYVIDGLLGHGGFGITYSAYDKVLNVKVAVKEYLPRQLATRAEGRTQVSVYSGEARQHYNYGLRKFMEEAQSVARFSHHPNIVSARDYFEANGTAYMVMEYVEGVTLKEYVEKKGGRISFEEAKGIMMPVMDALREVHQAGMLHRDISPDNIYITSSAQVKILDFGAARYFAGEHSKSLSVILKPGYAPEEQYRSSGKQGSWTDVYGVGATIYKALTGKTPPDALDRKEEDTLKPPSQLGVNIPPPAEQALLQALAVTASQRFRTMDEFQQALLGGTPMSMGFQTGAVSWQPPPGPAYTPVSAPVAESAPVAAQPSSAPVQQPPPYPEVPRRSANPAAIAAGIGAGVLGLVLVVGLVWWLGTRDPGKVENVTLKTGKTSGLSAKLDKPTAPGGEKPPIVTGPGDIAKAELDKGRKYYEDKDYPNAQKALAEAVRRHPQEAEAHYLLGLTHSSLKKPQPREALEEFRQAVTLKPDTYSWRGIGSELANLERHELAAAAFKEAADANPGDAALRYHAGEAYVKADEIKKAREEHKILQDLDQELAKKLLASINRRSGKGRSMGRQIDDLATRIRIQRGEITPDGQPIRKPQKRRAPSASPTPRPPVAQAPAGPAPAAQPAQAKPQYGVGWGIKKEGERRIR